MALLAGLDARPWLLIVHFFCVTLLGMRACMRQPAALLALQGVWQAVLLLATALRIMLPILRDEGFGCDTPL